MICPICSNDKIEFKFSNRDRLYGITNKLFHWFECKDCGLLFINPTPSSEELAGYYPSNYVSMINSKDSRNSLIANVYDTYYGPDKSFALKKILYLPAKNLIRSLPLRPRAKFLDIGCGNGRFLEYVDINGMQPYGIDPFVEKDIPELGIKKGDLINTGYPDDYFDFITLNNVLEHVTNPLEVLAECKRILGNGGKILVNIPNSSSLNRHLFGKNWVSLDTPRHVFIYSKKTMDYMCRKIGLKIVVKKYKSEAFTLIGSLIYSLSDLKSIHNSKTVSSLLLNAIAFPYAMLANLFKVGDQIEYWLETEE